MIMKFMDWLNGKTGLKVKHHCDFECTYIWASLFFNIMMLAFMTVGLSTLVFIISLIVLAHMEYFNLDLPEILVWVKSKGDRINRPELGMILYIDGLILLFVGMVFQNKLNRLLTKVLNKYCKRLVKEE